MSSAITQPICIARGVSKTFRISVTDQDNEAVDLTGATVYFRVKRLVTDAIVEIDKDSGTPAEITILTQTGATLGKADIFLVPSDTELLEPAKHSYSVWVETASGDRHAVIPTSDFIIQRDVTELFVSTPPSFPGSAASQNPDQQSFTYTVTAGGTAHTVTMPSAMFDATYAVIGVVNTPAGAETVYIISIPEASRTTTEFVFNTSATLSAGSTVDFIVRDKA